MQKDDNLSRYEVNRNVRTVFTRHEADMTKIDYSFMGSTVYIYGDLVKPEGEFSPQEIEVMAKEILALPNVHDLQFDLNNWVMIAAEDSRQFRQTKKSTAPKTAQKEAVSTDSTIVIERAEDLTVVLDDIKEKAKK